MRFQPPLGTASGFEWAALLGPRLATAATVCWWR